MDKATEIANLNQFRTNALNMFFRILNDENTEEEKKTLASLKKDIAKLDAKLEKLGD